MIVPDEPPGRRLNWWQSLLVGVGTLVSLLWCFGPLAVRVIAPKLRMRRAVTGVMEAVRDRARPGLTIDVEPGPGGFAGLSGGTVRLAFELVIGDTGLIPAPEVVYLSGVTASKAPMPGAAAELVGLLGGETPPQGYERIQHRSSEELSVDRDSAATGDRWLHVGCASRVTVTKDVRYVERVYRFNIGRDGARVGPVPDTWYQGWVSGAGVSFDQPVDNR